MYPNREDLRSSAEPSPMETLGKDTVSYSVCDDSYPPQIVVSAVSEVIFPPVPLGGWPTAVDPTTRKPRQWNNRKHIGERLFAKVDPNGPEMRPGLGQCWQWLGGVTGGGSVKHGQIMWRERYSSPQKVHRVAWELFMGAIPANRQINHHCDNPLCVRLEHLYLGTQKQNLLDATVRGRLVLTGARQTSVLTPDERLFIYTRPNHRGLPGAFARYFGVSASCISVIRKGRFIRPQRVPQDEGVQPQAGSGLLHVGDQTLQVVRVRHASQDAPVMSGHATYKG